MRRSIFVPCFLVALCVPSLALAANYDEATNGDISGNRLAPSVIPLNLGVNSISATSVAGDLEYFTVTVPAGQRLLAIRVTAYAGLDGRAFIGVQQGATFTEPPVGTNVAQLLGYAHFGPAEEAIGSNRLDNIATGPGSQGFSGVLGPGTYTFWSQQTGGNASTYTLAFDVATIPAVPVPPLFAGVLALGLGVIGIRRMAARSQRKPT
jgi:hypothetical protein